MKAPDKCVHFNGIQNAECREHVRYRDVEDRPATGGIRLPCLTFAGREPASKTCEKKRLPTAEEIAADEKELDDHLAAFAAGISPCCKAPINEEHVAKAGRHKGTGPRYCAKCGALLFHGCGRGSIR